MSLWTNTRKKISFAEAVYLVRRINLPYRSLWRKYFSCHSSLRFLCQPFNVNWISQVKQHLLETEEVYICLLHAKVLMDTMTDETKEDQPVMLRRGIKTLYCESLWGTPGVLLFSQGKRKYCPRRISRQTWTLSGQQMSFVKWENGIKKR